MGRRAGAERKESTFGKGREKGAKMVNPLPLKWSHFWSFFKKMHQKIDAKIDAEKNT